MYRYTEGYFLIKIVMDMLLVAFFNNMWIFIFPFVRDHRHLLHKDPLTFTLQYQFLAQPSPCPPDCLFLEGTDGGFLSLLSPRHWWFLESNLFGWALEKEKSNLTNIYLWTLHRAKVVMGGFRKGYFNGLHSGYKYIGTRGFLQGPAWQVRHFTLATLGWPTKS